MALAGVMLGAAAFWAAGANAFGISDLRDQLHWHHKFTHGGR